MTVEETLKLIAQQWGNLSDLMKLANIGRNSALTIKSKIKNNLEKEGYYVVNVNLFCRFLVKLFSSKYLATFFFIKHDPIAKKTQHKIY